MTIVWKQLKYFFYLASNWNISIAWHILRNEIRGERRYEIDSTGYDDLYTLHKRRIDISHSTSYMPCSYDVLEKVFTYLQKEKVTSLLDVGCGKGRALCVAAHFGFKKLVGIDFSPEFCEATQKNLSTTQQTFPNIQFEVHHQDAAKYAIPSDIQCMFLFNPFDDVILNKVMLEVEISLRKSPRTFYIVYVNSVHHHVISTYNFDPVFQIEEKVYLQATIYKKAPL